MISSLKRLSWNWPPDPRQRRYLSRQLPGIDETRSGPLVDQDVVALLSTDYSRCQLVIELLGDKKLELKETKGGLPQPASF